MKNGFRQSMAWLHTWTGVLLCWLLFAIFVTGTIAYFRQEVTFWMQPELHETGAYSPADAPQAARVALDKLAEIAPDAESWSVSLPESRSPTTSISWREQGAPPGRRGFESAVLNPETGERLHPRETAGGNFLYRFHFELYALPRNVARWIVGIATAFMFIAIISGIITHKKIFKDFFTFRPAKGQRSWLDMHNVTAVLALPFHLMITYSGLLLFMATLLPFAFESGRRGPPTGAREQPQQVAQAQSVPAPPVLAPIAPMLSQAERIWGMPAGRISIDKPGGDAPRIELAPMRNRKLTAHSGSGSNGVERLTFDGKTGTLLSESDGPAHSAVSATYNAFGSLHRARFADTALRWIFFAAGVAGTVMSATGLLLWVSKRAAKHTKADREPLGLAFVRRLNVGTIAGLMAAVAAYFWANRLLPAELEARPLWEIRTFFAVWAILLIYPAFRKVSRAWPEELATGAVLFATLPLLDALTTDTNGIDALLRGQWVLVGFDLVALATALSLGVAAWKMARSEPARARKAKTAAPQPAVQPMVTEESS